MNVHLFKRFLFVKGHFILVFQVQRSFYFLNNKKNCILEEMLFHLLMFENELLKKNLASIFKSSIA